MSIDMSVLEQIITDIECEMQFAEYKKQEIDEGVDNGEYAEEYIGEAVEVSEAIKNQIYGMECALNTIKHYKAYMEALDRTVIVNKADIR